MTEWKHVTITEDDLEDLRAQAGRNNRSAASELHVVLEAAGVLRKPVEAK